MLWLLMCRQQLCGSVGVDSFASLIILSINYDKVWMKTSLCVCVCVNLCDEFLLHFSFNDLCKIFFYLQRFINFTLRVCYNNTLTLWVHIKLPLPTGYVEASLEDLVHGPGVVMVMTEELGAVAHHGPATSIFMLTQRERGGGVGLWKHFHTCSVNSAGVRINMRRTMEQKREETNKVSFICNTDTPEMKKIVFHCNPFLLSSHTHSWNRSEFCFVPLRAHHWCIVGDCSLFPRGQRKVGATFLMQMNHLGLQKFTQGPAWSLCVCVC